MEELEEILIYFATSMAGKNSEEEILWDLAQNCIGRLGFVDCVVYLLDEERGVLVQKATLGAKNPQPNKILDPIEIPLGRGITGSVAQTGKAEIIGNTASDPRYIVDDDDRLSEIAVPIKVGDRVLGLIDSEHPNMNFFTDQDLRILMAVASICANKIERVRAETQMLNEQQKRLEVQSQMNKWKAQALRTQMSPHFVFNALNAIQHFITINDKWLAIRFLSLFSKLIRYHLKYYEQDVVALSEELNMLEWYLQLQELRYEDRFEYLFEVDNKQSVNQIAVPTLVLSALMENAIEKTMLRVDGKGCVRIKVRILEEEVKFEVFYCTDGNPAVVGERLADYRNDLPNLDTHIEFLKEVKNYKVQFESQFLEESTEQQKGVKIVLSLPAIPL